MLIGFGAALFVGGFLGLLSDLMRRSKENLFVVLYLGPHCWNMEEDQVLAFGYQMYVCLWQHQYFPAVLRHRALLNMTRLVQRYYSALSKNEKFEHDDINMFFFWQQGHRQNILNETFWLITFLESASLIGSQVIGNWLVGSNLEKGIASPSTAAILLAIVGIICMSRDYDGTSQAVKFKDYKVSFYTYILGDRRIWLLACVQACLHFSIVVSWILWAPTLVG